MTPDNPTPPPAPDSGDSKKKRNRGEIDAKHVAEVSLSEGIARLAIQPKYAQAFLDGEISPVILKGFGDTVAAARDLITAAETATHERTASS